MAYHYVKIYYGPSDSFYTVAHKPQKLRGLKDSLQKHGFRVDLAPVKCVNYCALEMCGHEVFRCNLKHLSFNAKLEQDVVAQRALKAVVEATLKFKRARSYLWFWTLLEQNMFTRESGPKDYWPQPNVLSSSFQREVSTNNCDRDQELC